MKVHVGPDHADDLGLFYFAVVVTVLAFTVNKTVSVLVSGMMITSVRGFAQGSKRASNHDPHPIGIMRLTLK